MSLLTKAFSDANLTEAVIGSGGQEVAVNGTTKGEEEEPRKTVRVG